MSHVFFINYNIYHRESEIGDIHTWGTFLVTGNLTKKKHVILHFRLVKDFLLPVFCSVYYRLSRSV